MTATSKKKRPVGRPRTGQRPVIAMRIHEPLYEAICSAALDDKLTISEEAQVRLAKSFGMEVPAAPKMDRADIKIRLTEELRSKIEMSAKVAGVSMNAEMISRLNLSFEQASVERLIEHVVLRTLEATNYKVAA